MRRSTLRESGSHILKMQRILNQTMSLKSRSVGRRNLQRIATSWRHATFRNLFVLHYVDTRSGMSSFRTRRNVISSQILTMFNCTHRFFQSNCFSLQTPHISPFLRLVVVIFAHHSCSLSKRSCWTKYQVWSMARRRKFPKHMKRPFETVWWTGEMMNWLRTTGQEPWACQGRLSFVIMS